MQKYKFYTHSVFYIFEVAMSQVSCSCACCCFCLFVCLFHISTILFCFSCTLFKKSWIIFSLCLIFKRLLSNPNVQYKKSRHSTILPYMRWRNEKWEVRRALLACRWRTACMWQSRHISPLWQNLCKQHARLFVCFAAVLFVLPAWSYSFVLLIWYRYSTHAQQITYILLYARL